MLNSLCRIDIQARDLNLSDFKKRVFEIGWRFDAYEPNMVCDKHD